MFHLRIGIDLFTTLKNYLRMYRMYTTYCRWHTSSYTGDTSLLMCHCKTQEGISKLHLFSKASNSGTQCNKNHFCKRDKQLDIINTENLFDLILIFVLKSLCIYNNRFYLILIRIWYIIVSFRTKALRTKTTWIRIETRGTWLIIFTS
jgi:hypothetical protein